MNKNDSENHEMQDETVNDERLVPVGEAIRYRKRAQNAEGQVSQLSEELENANAHARKLSAELEAVRLENSLVSKLVSAGASDLETAVLLAKKRLESGDDTDVSKVVEQLMDEKEHLFAARRTGAAVTLTSGAKQRNEAARKGLEKIAHRASSSGSRVDVQEYMRARRQYI